MTLSYVSESPKRTWRDVLAVVIVKGELTAKDLSKFIGVAHAEACVRLKRLQQWGMVRVSGNQRNGTRIFEVTDYGNLVHANPTESPKEVVEETEVSDTDEAYPALDDLWGIIDGPVSLQRLVAIDDVAEATRHVPAANLAVERKFDGWLCQVAGGRIYSRRGKELTKNFPQILSAVGRFRGEHLIGELVYWGPDGKMDQPMVTTVAGTADPEEAIAKASQLPGIFQIVLFDVIGVDGRDVSKQPFKERRKRLESLVRPSRHLALSPIYPFARWREAYDAALAEGGEGVVLKNVDAPYFWRPLGEREEKRVGVQYKLKARKTDDFIVFNIAFSEKKRLLMRFGQFWKGELVEVGEVDNLSMDTTREAIEHFKRGPFVTELSYQERFPKPPGRLRNPVFERFRPDKPIESVTLPAKYAPKG